MRSTRHRALALSALAAVALATLQCSEAPPPPPELAPGGPRLLVLIVVDQFRYDYLERFGPHFEGGLKWLREQGVVFANAHYDHALTVTAAGHSALSTGLHPSRSGIISNVWLDRQTGDEIYSYADTEHGRSPVNLLGTTLADWVKELDPGARVYSISHKDRSAIALGGHRADGAYWYANESGEWVSSAYYPDPEPKWLADFHDRHLPDAYFGKMWEPIELTADELEAAGVGTVDEGVFGRRLPYPFGGPRLTPDSSFYGAFRGSPYADEYMLALAQSVVENKELGQREHLDVLALGLSVLDSVGHSFGPDSREVADTLLRLDRSLQTFFDFLGRTVGLDRVVIGFSSDHGVLPMPEYLQSKGIDSRRMDGEDRHCFQNAGLAIQEQYRLEDWVLGGFYLDHKAIADAGAEYADVEASLAREIEKCSIVERVWTRTELQATRLDEPDHFRRLYRHSFHPERSADLMVQLVENAISSSSSTRATHGSPYEYDTHVPLIFVIPGIDPTTLHDPARPVDLAPTLAAQLGIPYPDDLDGTDLSDLISSRSGGQRGKAAYAPTE